MPCQLPSRKRSSSDPADQENQDPNGSTIKDYKYFGRVLSRQIEPFSSIDAMVNFGIKRDSADDEEESATLSERQVLAFDSRLSANRPI